MKTKEEVGTKHTPGVWEIYDYNMPNGEQTISASYESERVTKIATCYNPQAKANARLIAACPELLEAAKAIIGKESKITSRHAWQEYRDLESAIAKAEGSL